MPGDGELTSNIKKKCKSPGVCPGGGGGKVTGGIEPGIKFVRIYTEWKMLFSTRVNRECHA